MPTSEELFKALQSGDARDLRRLLTPAELGAHHEGLRQSGYTLMAVAAQHGRADMVHVLAEAGLNVNEVDASGSRPLHHAAMFGHIDG